MKRSVRSRTSTPPARSRSYVCSRAGSRRGTGIGIVSAPDTFSGKTTAFGGTGTSSSSTPLAASRRCASRMTATGSVTGLPSASPVAGSASPGAGSAAPGAGLAAPVAGSASPVTGSARPAASDAGAGRLSKLTRRSSGAEKSQPSSPATATRRSASASPVSRRSSARNGSSTAPASGPPHEASSARAAMPAAGRRAAYVMTV